MIPGDPAGPRYAERVGICLLRRGSGIRPGLERISVGQAVAEVGTRLEPGFGLFASTIGERIARIAERGAWALTLAGAPDGAVPFLDEIARTLERDA